MTKTKTTKRALITSVLSLLVCFSMLIGSTFAWFTDTATTGVNTIKSGNLDIKLSYKNSSVTTWTEVSSSSKLFKDAALWEPGYTEVAYLKVENKGTLAFKYQFTVNVINEIVGKSVLGNDIKLSEVLKYDLVELTSDTTYTDRTKALAAVTDPKNLATEVVKGNMEAKADAKYFALIVYMPTDVDNKANHNGTDIPSIQLGVNVSAAQYTSEKDSYGSDYDAKADLPELASSIVVADTDTVIEANGVKVTVPGGASDEAVAGDTLTLSVEETTAPSTISISAADEVIESLEISLVNQDGEKVESDGNSILVETTITKGLGTIAVYHNGTELSGVEYNSETGLLKFYTNSFSPFVVVEKDAYAVVSDASALNTAIANGDSIKLSADITLDAGTTVTVQNSTEIDLNGYSLIRATGSYSGMKVTSADAEVIFTNGKFISTKGGSVMRIEGAEKITFNDVDFICEAAGSTGNKFIETYMSSDADLDIEFNNCTLDKGCIVPHNQAVTFNMTFNNCNFNWDDKNGTSFIKMQNQNTGTITLDTCTFNYTNWWSDNLIQTNQRKNFPLTVNLKDITVTGESGANNKKPYVVGWYFNSYTQYITVNVEGTNTYTYDGTTLDWETVDTEF